MSEVIGQRFASFPAAGGRLAALGFSDFVGPLRRSLSQSLARSPDFAGLPSARLFAHLLGRPVAAGAVCGALALLPVCCAWTPGLAADEADWSMRARHLLLPVTTLALLGGQYCPAYPGRVAEVLESDFYPLRPRFRGWRLAHAAFSCAAPRP